MPDAQPALREAADSVSPGRTSFRYDNSQGSHPYYGSGDTFSLEAYVKDILGSNALPVPRTGAIKRTLPRRHPKAAHLWASSLEEVGYGVPELEDSVPGLGAGSEPIVARVGSYPEVTLAVSFEHKKYNLIDDDQISVENLTWVDPGGKERSSKYATEFLRFCEWRKRHTPAVMSCQMGQMMFATRDVTHPLHKTAFPGSPRIDYPEFTLTCLWTAVPYSYVYSQRSYLDNLANKVNYHAMDLENYHFEPGQLLYEGYQYTDFNPPYAPANVLDGTAGALINAKFVNVEMTFKVAYRAAVDPPDLGNRPYWPVNGHNCLPNFYDRTFRYVCGFRRTAGDPASVDNKDYWHPLFIAGPLLLLWTDPDAPQPDPPLLEFGGKP